MIGIGLVLVLAAMPPRDSGPVLSEFMALNHATLDDEDGDSSDWIEVTNADIMRAYTKTDPSDFECARSVLD